MWACGQACDGQDSVQGTEQLGQLQPVRAPTTQAVLQSCTTVHAALCRDLSVDEAIELGRRSIYHATFRDAVSGGTVSGERWHWGCRSSMDPRLHRFCF